MLAPPKLTPRLKSLLGLLLKSGKTDQDIATRGRMILDLHDLHGKVPITRIADLARQHRATVYRWHKRWQEKVAGLIEADQAGADEKLLTAKIYEALDDAPRSGAPPCVHRRANHSDRGGGLRKAGRFAAAHQPMDEPRDRR